jgi:hypothetical protein
VRSQRRSFLAVLLALSALLLSSGSAQARPVPKNQVFQVVPIVVDNVRVITVDGVRRLVADVTIGDVTETIDITNLSILPGANGAACPILHLELEIEELNLLGLVVELDNCEEGPIEVDVTAVPGGLLGDLLCGLLGGLDLGLDDLLDLGELLDLLTDEEEQQLFDLIERILNRLLNQATSSSSLANAQSNVNDTCTILDLEVGAITLDLLGLLVETSDICLSITAEEGGGLLGNLLCNVDNLLSGNANLRAKLNALLRLLRAIERASGG